MSIRVYRFGARQPLDLEIVLEQLRATHAYQAELYEYERGRRTAMRALYDTPEIHEAEATLRAATKSDKKAAKRALFALRRSTLETQRERASEINRLAHALQLGARARTTSFWGSYLDVEARVQASRSAPLYNDEGLEPRDPRIRPWSDSFSDGQIGVQIQRPITTAEVVTGKCSYVRVERTSPRSANISIRVGSVGRDPIWARVPIVLDREIPDAARWRWVRLSRRVRGYEMRWSVEITIDDPAPAPRTLDATLRDTVAISWCWRERDDGSACVAEWVGESGARGEIGLTAHEVKGLRKPHDIRAVRAMIVEDFRPRFVRAVETARTKEKLPAWLVDAALGDHTWKSEYRLHALRRRWMAEECNAARPAFELLDEWYMRDRHLLDYQEGQRRGALARRLDHYRCEAAKFARRYRTALVSDHDLSREARFGDDSDRRFMLAPDQLRGAVKNAFGADAINTTWRLPASDEDDKRSWCERVLALWSTEGARNPIFAAPKEKPTNAWAARKKKKQENKTARKGAANAAE